HAPFPGQTREQKLEIFSDQFSGGIAEKFLDLRVDEDDTPMAIENEKPFRGGSKHGFRYGISEHNSPWCHEIPINVKQQELRNGRVRRLLIEPGSTRSEARVELRTLGVKAICTGTATGTRTGTAQQYSGRFG